MSTEVSAATAIAPGGRGGARPGFGGWRPWGYHLLLLAAPGGVLALLGLVGLNGVVFYRGLSAPVEVVAAAAVMQLLGVVLVYGVLGALAFPGGRLGRGQFGTRFAVVTGAMSLISVAAFAAVAVPLLLADAHPNLATTAGEGVARPLSLLVWVLSLRYWAYRPAPADDIERPLLAGADWMPSVSLDPELTALAAGERMAATLTRWRGWLLSYVLIAAVLLVFGWYSSITIALNNGDGTARVTQAFNAVFSRDPHLGTLSLIWPPIPALVDIVFVVLLRPFDQVFFAGAAMGALFTAGAILVFYALLRELGAGWRMAALLTIAFATNQHVYQSSAAGLSEAPFAFFCIASILGYVRWMREEQSGQLIFAGLMASGAVMSRYEALFLAGAQAVGVVLVLSRQLPYVGWLRLSQERPRAADGAITGSLVALLAPFAFVMLVWTVVNYQIKGDPMFFLTGPGSTRTAPDTAKVYGPGFPLYYAYNSVSGTVSLAWDRLWYLSPLMGLSTVVLGLRALARRNLDILVLGIVAWSIVVFPIVTGYTGSLPPWVRYWYWLVPAGMMLAVVLLREIQSTAMRDLLSIGVVALAFLPNARIAYDTYHGFPTENLTHEEKLASALLTNVDLYHVPQRQQAVEEYRRVAALVNREVPPDAKLMLDVIGPGGPIPMFLDHPEQVVATTDRDFESEYLDRPWATVDYVLVPRPDFNNESRSVVLQKHLGIWRGVYPWTEFVAEVGRVEHWRLFRVVPGLTDAQATRLPAGVVVEEAQPGIDPITTAPPGVRTDLDRGQRSASGSASPAPAGATDDTGNTGDAGDGAGSGEAAGGGG